MAEGLWAFSLRFYDDAPTQAACLALQDEAGGDVNVMLWLLWRASRGEMIGPEGVAELDALVAPWREAVVRPLRTVRREMKARALGPDPEAQEAVRAQVKKVELSAEKAQQAVLEAAEIAADTKATPQEAAAQNLASLAAHLGRAIPDDVTEALLLRFSAVA